ncbi:protein-S-isoprenylcysteine O-methyltransferase Ste14 [Rhizobium petrolearium]|uniref:methyltransferase family protein n=1 Tax=Neorhizobium petrolearium TaxID=515361 RepID=UPI001AE9A796|nr:isoprenylcysteine carboxylmethyltransferase family protein [Neorhizobium petrolearium]MBP1843014.1 protein-S-isoprenylcysteine O-methyltransferase Ste14 [Neorhizobium petrolearium]
MQGILDTLITITSITVISFYTWSLKNHFTSVAMTWRARLISAAVILTTLLFLYLQWTGTQLLWVQTVGLIIEIAAAALFWWAIWASRQARLRFAFDPALPHGIVSDGPYRYLRHPFYSSYLMFWSGWALASWSSIWSPVPVIFFAIVYIAAARMEERNFETSQLADEYREYKRRTGFFIPRIGRD